MGKTKENQMKKTNSNRFHYLVISVSAHAEEMVTINVV
jgi:hypothetical protein